MLKDLTHSKFIGILTLVGGIVLGQVFFVSASDVAGEALEGPAEHSE